MAIAGAAQIRRADTEPGLQARPDHTIAMTQINDYYLLTPRLTSTEAKIVVMAWWKADETDETRLYRIQGEIVGPLCEYANTLHTRVPLQPDPPGARRIQPLRARANVLEPCFWEPQHPFCYEINLELYGSEYLLDMRRIICGIRHLNVHGNDLFLNGQPFFLQGVEHSVGNSIAELEDWHKADCGAFLTDASNGLCDRTDRWGPMVLHMLVPGKGEALKQVAQLRNHPSLLMWVLPAGLSDDPLYLFTEAIRKLDPSRLIGRLVGMSEFVGAHESTQSLGPVDVLLLPFQHPDISQRRLDKPYIIMGHAKAGTQYTPKDFDERLAELRDTIGSPPGLVGVIL